MNTVELEDLKERSMEDLTPEESYLLLHSYLIGEHFDENAERIGLNKKERDLCSREIACALQEAFL